MIDNLNKLKHVRLKYYDWLYSLIGFDDSVDGDKILFPYNIVVSQLFLKEFYSLIPYDENRDVDARTLRDRYIYEKFENAMEAESVLEYLSGPTNLLEVMIGLAERMDENLCNPENGRVRIVESFWELFKNLGLDKFKDEEFLKSYNLAQIDEIASRLVDRKYDRNGKGGFFPLEHPKEDQRHVELWYQMQAWLLENYDMEDKNVQD